MRNIWGISDPWMRLGSIASLLYWTVKSALQRANIVWRDLRLGYLLSRQWRVQLDNIGRLEPTMLSGKTSTDTEKSPAFVQYLSLHHDWPTVIKYIEHCDGQTLNNNFTFYRFFKNLKNFNRKTLYERLFALNVRLLDDRMMIYDSILLSMILRTEGSIG